MEPFYLWLSNLIVIIHFLYILFVLLGALLVLRWPWMIWLHLPAVVWGVLVEFMGWYCPLTPWENQLRRMAGREVYEGDFIGEYLLPLIYPVNLTREMQYLFAAIVILINVVSYYFILYRHDNRTS